MDAGSPVWIAFHNTTSERDAAHLADGIDPNQDVTMVVTVLNWILAELIRSATTSHQTMPL